MSSSATDVIVIGGGFAGLTAARELQNSGLQTLVLEARDRLGGRTWTKEFSGKQVELGGAWVHWHQPHVWTEITRYGLTLAESGVAADEGPRSRVFAGIDLTDQRHASDIVPQVGWVVGDEFRTGAVDDAVDRINDGVRRVCADAYGLLARPHDPLRIDVSGVESMTVRDRLDSLDLDPDTAVLTEAALATCCSAHLEEVGLLAVLRWYALSGGTPELLWDCVDRYKIKSGTKSLIDALALDAQMTGADIRLGKAVSSVSQAGKSIEVSTLDGESFVAGNVICAIPLNTMSGIKFLPELSSLKSAAIQAGQPSHGVKAWVKIKGRHEYFGAGATSLPFTWLQSEYLLGEDTIFFAFGSDSDSVDLASAESVSDGVRRLMPDAEVIDHRAHDWVRDSRSMGTWSMPGPELMSRYLHGLQQPDGGLFLAGSDVANGWNGFIDGAIESGLSVARRILARQAAPHSGGDR
ncbi:flavin monoamine oxidase family protein [Micromonospora sp. DT44]|uniref:flavin monoamine oxidase family protein n=1 Tax=Micromonospora sp. DT44 TaxID=3393439 RepID=UPI003CF0D5EF